MGCIKVSHTEVVYKPHTFPPVKNESMIKKVDFKSGPGFWSNPLHIYEFGLDFEDSTNLDLTIRLSCDDEFNLAFENAIPTKIPQTHYSKARNEDNYYVSHNGFEIKGRKSIELKLEKLSFLATSWSKNSDSEIRLKANMKLCDAKEESEDVVILDAKKSQNNPDNYELYIMGNIQSLSGDVEVYLNDDANLNCDSFKENKILHDNFLNNTHFIEFFNDKINEEKSFYIRKDIKFELVLKLLGKSLILSGKEGKMIGKIKIEQSYQCENVK